MPTLCRHLLGEGPGSASPDVIRVAEARPIAVAATGLSRRYGRRWALTNIGFEIPRGALAMVTGRNGSGKSTLLRILATAIRADQGTVRILGYDVRGDRERVRERTALLDHHTHLYEPLTAVEARLLAQPQDQLPTRDNVEGFVRRPDGHPRYYELHKT